MAGVVPGWASGERVCDLQPLGTDRPMSDKSDAKKWRNPLFVENAGAERISASLTRGAELRRKAAAGMGARHLRDRVCRTLDADARWRWRASISWCSTWSTPASRLLGARAAGCWRRTRSASPIAGASLGRGRRPHRQGARHRRPWRDGRHVDTPERARAVVEQARFAPHGQPRLLAADASTTRSSEPLQALDDSTYVVVQIEGRKALEQVRRHRRGPRHRCGLRRAVRSRAVARRAAGQPARGRARRRASQSRCRTGVALGIYIDDPATCGDWAQRGASRCSASASTAACCPTAPALVATQAKRATTSSHGRKACIGDVTHGTRDSRTADRRACAD